MKPASVMRQRRLPFIKLTSRIVRFPKTEVDDYLARHFHINASNQETRWNFPRRFNSRRAPLCVNPQLDILS